MEATEGMIEEQIAIKVHETEKGAVIGACDKELLGTKLSYEGAEVKIPKEFFFERYTQAEELVTHIENCFTANLFGKRTVDAYCEKNPDAQESVMHIQGVPHLQIFHI